MGTDTGLDAIDASTGTVTWTYTPPEGGGVHSPAIADGLVYASTDQAGYIALDEATGTLAWSHDTGADNVGTAVVADGVAFVGATDDVPGHLTALDAKTGAVLWTDDEQLHSPAVADGVAIGGGPIGVVVAHDVMTGKELWRTPIADKTRPVAIADGVAYVAADTQHKVYALDAATGTELWDFNVDSGLDCCIAVADGAVLVGSGLGGVYAIGGSENPAAMPSGVPLQVASAAPSSASPGPSSVAASPAFQGTWHTDPLTEDQVAAAFVAAGGTDADGRAFFQQLGGGATKSAVIELILDSGSFTEHEIGDSGLPVVGDRARYDATDSTLTYRASDCVHVYSWKVEGDTLRLQTEQPCSSLGHYGTTLYASFPFHRGPAPKGGVAAPSPAPSPIGFDPTMLEGTWTTRVTAADEARAGLNGDPCVADGKSGTLVLTIDHGMYIFGETCPGIPFSVGDRGTVVLTPDTFSHFPDGGPTHGDFDWRLDGSALDLRYRDSTGDPIDLPHEHYGWEHTWTRKA